MTNFNERIDPNLYRDWKSLLDTREKKFEIFLSNFVKIVKKEKLIFEKLAFFDQKILPQSDFIPVIYFVQKKYFILLSSE